MSGPLVQIPFHGDMLDCVQQDGKVWFSIRRGCENLGLATQSQLQKLKGKSWACVTEIVMQLPGESQSRSLSVIDLDSLPMWLATIEARKVKEHLREKLACYQNEVKRVLADHFFGRTAPSASPVMSQTEVEQLIRRVMSEGRPGGPVQAMPRSTVQERLRFKGWDGTSAKQRSQIRRLANSLLDLRHQETPDVSGLVCTYYGHQLVILDEAIDRVREEYRRRDAERGAGLLVGVKG